MSFGTLQIEKMTTESGYSLGAGNATSFKNRLINGGMTIAQRTTSATSSGSTYVCDRFLAYASGGTGGYTASQSSDAPTGFVNSLLATVTTTGTQGESGFLQYVEGYNFADAGWGTASAKSVTISFWVKSSLTGTFAYILRTTGGAYSYVTSYTINAANTWEYKTITIPGNTVSSLNGTTGFALIAEWTLGGTGSATSTQNTWLTGNFYNLTGAVNVLLTSGATFAVTGCQLEIGTVATSFDQRDYGRELMLCQRYYWQSFDRGFPNATPITPVLTSNSNRISLPISQVPMRITPTLVGYNAAGSAGSMTEFSSGTTVAISSLNPTYSSGGGYAQFVPVISLLNIILKVHRNLLRP
jgi:hypothetical protein